MIAQIGNRIRRSAQTVGRERAKVRIVTEAVRKLSGKDAPLTVLYDANIISKRDIAMLGSFLKEHGYDACCIGSFGQSLRPIEVIDIGGLPHYNLEEIKQLISNKIA